MGGALVVTAKKIKRLQVKLRTSGFADAAEPIIEFIPGRKSSTYLWIGNNADGDKRCYGTVAGAITLRKLAKAILAEVGE